VSYKIQNMCFTVSLSPFVCSLFSVTFCFFFLLCVLVLSLVFTNCSSHLSLL